VNSTFKDYVYKVAGENITPNVERPDVFIHPGKNLKYFFKFDAIYYIINLCVYCWFQAVV